MMRLRRMPSALLPLGMALHALVIAIGTAWPAHAQQDASPETGPTPSGVRLPELITFVEASYTKAALEARVHGRVVLELTISEQGTVLEAKVVEGLGFGLDEAATGAALQFLFSPASQDGVPRTARIRYVYQFRLPAEQQAPLPSVAASGAPLSTQPESAVPADGQLQALPAAPTPKESLATAAQPTPTPQEPSLEESSPEVVVQGLRAIDKKRRSSAAVTVVDLNRAKRESADVAEVLARVEGVNVQRMGGLGSAARFSLAGYDDAQIRFFIDGIPMEYQGFSMGLQNVPLIFADRVDVYKGVVPVTLGADSLGGAFDLLTDRRTRGTRAFASYQGGAFDTHRINAGARHLDADTGAFVKAEAFLDSSDNSYPIQVLASDVTGEVVELTVNRFHDAYRASGVNLEAGLVNRGWADRFLLKGFINGYSKELQHNALMTLPYAEAEFGGVSRGLSLRYEHYFGLGLRGSFVTGYVYDRTDFLDDPSCINDWYGQCLIEIQGSGELRDTPTDQSVWDHTGYGRWNLNWHYADGGELVLSTAPTFFTRAGDNRLLPETSNFNELKAQRDLFKWISGLEHRAQLLDERIENSTFLKSYFLSTQSEEIYNDYIKTPKSAQNLYWGVGNGARFAFSDWALVKASYEYSIRLPEPREIFGNTVQIAENLDLQPERSHNVNLSFLVTDAESSVGLYNASLTGFFREAEQLVLLIGQTDLFRYENAYAARVYGVEGGASWLSPGNFLELGLNATYQEYRNRSSDGAFSQFDGDRIPNKPYLFGNGTARLMHQGAIIPGDELAFTWYSRYTHEFLRGWESVGSNYEQPTVPTQFVQTATLSYLVRGESSRELSFTAEGRNLTNEKTFDFYRVQKPGRAFYFKASLSN